LSPNLADLDRSIEALTEDQPREGARERALQRLTTPIRRKPLGPVVATTLAFTLIGVIVFPRKASGSAWAQVVQAAQEVRTYHSVMIDEHGRKYREDWAAPGRFAAVDWLGWNGALHFEERDDGHRYFVYFDEPKRGPNAVSAASVVTERPEWRHRVSREADTVTSLLRLPTAKLIRQEKQGKYNRFTIEVRGSQISLDADSENGRVVTMYFQNGARRDFDYPATIDPKVFEPRAQAATGILTLDLDEENARDLPAFKRGIAKKDGITLRFVGISTTGSLWAFWTGYVPDGRLSRPMQVVGVPSDPAFEPGPFTTEWAHHGKGNRFLIDGQQIAGAARDLKRKIGRTVTLRIPAKHAYVTFKDVPAVRFRDWSDLISSNFPESR